MGIKRIQEVGGEVRIERNSLRRVVFTRWDDTGIWDLGTQKIEGRKAKVKGKIVQFKLKFHHEQGSNVENRDCIL